MSAIQHAFGAVSIMYSAPLVTPQVRLLDQAKHGIVKEIRRKHKTTASSQTKACLVLMTMGR